MRFAPDDASVPEQIEKWAKSNDWYNASVYTNQVKVQMAFWDLVERTAHQLDYHDMGWLRRLLHDCWDLLMGKCHQIDAICHVKCQTQKQVRELKSLRTKTVGILNELADIFRVIQDEAANAASKPISSNTAQDKWITLSRAAEIMMADKSTVLRWIKKGKIIDNGQTGRNRLLCQNSVLEAKQAREDQDTQKDVKDIRKDARKYS